MPWKKILWGIIALCLVLSLWNICKSTYIGQSPSLHSLSKRPVNVGKLCSCNKCPEGSHLDWFCRNLDTSVNCLLTPENPEVPQGALQWWLRLQSSQDGSKLREVIGRLFDIFPSPVAGMQDIEQCGTCAVVGNSGRLKGSKYGEKIDSHHFVLRMNTAKTEGFEEDVGRRTTHHFMYPESAINLHPGIHLVLVPFKIMDLKWLASAFTSGDIRHTYTRVKQFLKADKSKILILNPAFLKYIQDNWTKHHGKYPSTGFIALMFAIHTCTQVSAFGFGADSKGNWHHYWEENRGAGAFRKTGVHDAIVEQGLIERLANESKVTLYK
ncbi:CMP-N-acetylneuraminate-beta-galactosamide-alpha-2,3-sialyltransferase 2-like [Tiliqua scincoides]|uniref:CMP-N-acetylneuraminate-beta-galactosamide- alpha-2,3-sialyltransferase 2-like n=1 Tax=Tiliqua scincoides TaxID=71010 RepID=UPI003462F217